MKVLLAEYLPYEHKYWENQLQLEREEYGTKWKFHQNSILIQDLEQ